MILIDLLSNLDRTSSSYLHERTVIEFVTILRV